ncbi:MAG: type III secretion system gatekeeper subunit SctW [Deltaproteobacteria bacterium]|jgi:type III secretion protein W|nr:type III secretion system gatekeeper subunit SctW [Deltaproteobacteria bacterium]
MSQRIDGPGANVQSAPGAAGEQAVQAGSFMGEAVLVDKDALSLLADAAEELSFSASENVEKKLTERKEGRDVKGTNLQRILFYVDQAGDMNRDDLEMLLRRLAGLKDAGSAKILNIVRQAFRDPANRHAALSYAGEKLDRAELAGENGAALRREIAAALEELVRTEGRAINAGYNTAGIDAPGLRETPPSLRLLYRDLVLDFESYEKTFGALLEKFGPDEFPKAVSYLIRSLGADMTALTPSSAPAALKETLDGLYMVESLGTLYRAAGALLKGATERHGALGITEKPVLMPLLRYKDVPVLSSRQIASDMSFLISGNAARDAELTQSVRELVRKIPHKLFASSETRQNTLLAFQELLDNAIDREEAAQEN